MNLPTISHPTDRANFCVVTIGDLSLAFSYQTVIGYRCRGGWTLCENEWGPTTGKHLNHLDPDRTNRVHRGDFEAGLSAALEWCS